MGILCLSAVVQYCLGSSDGHSFAEGHAWPTGVTTGPEALTWLLVTDLPLGYAAVEDIGQHCKRGCVLLLQILLSADQPQERTYDYHAGLAAALEDGQKLPEARASLRQSLDAVAWDDERHAKLLGQLIKVLVSSSCRPAGAGSDFVQAQGNCVGERLMPAALFAK